MTYHHIIWAHVAFLLDKKIPNKPFMSLQYLDIQPYFMEEISYWQEVIRCDLNNYVSSNAEVTIYQ